jgi:competence CoiA-like predicted nuclease
MFSALDNNNHLIDIDTAVKHTLGKYFCPLCHEECLLLEKNHYKYFKSFNI